MLDRSARPLRISAWALVAAAFLVACDGSDPALPDDPCNLSPLPLAGATAGPVVEDVALEVKPEGLVLLVTVVDPQGTADLANITQTVGIYPDAVCSGLARPFSDDLACSNCQESFGTVASPTDPLYGAVASADSWPVTLTITDRGGNVTTGNVPARVTR